MPTRNRQADSQLWRTVREHFAPLCEAHGYHRVAQQVGISEQSLRMSIRYGYNGMTGTTLDKLLEVFGLEMQIVIKPKEAE